MTDTRGLEEALRQSERRFHELAESMPHIVWTAKPDGSVDYQTDAVLRYTGRTAEEMVGERWLDVIHPDDREHTVEVWTGALETGQAYEVEFRIRAADGSYRWFLTRAIPGPSTAF